MYFYSYGMLNPTFVPNKEEFGDLGCVSQSCCDFDTLFFFLTIFTLKCL